MKGLKTWLLLTAIGFVLAAALPNGGQLEPKESKRQWDAKSIIIKELSPFDEIPRMFKMKETGWTYMYTEKPAYVERIYSTNADCKEVLAKFSQIAADKGWLRIENERKTGSERMRYIKKLRKEKGTVSCWSCMMAKPRKSVIASAGSRSVCFAKRFAVG